MAFNELLRLIVEADTKGAVASVERLGKSADRELSRATDKTDLWGNRLTKVGTGLLTFGAVATAGLAMAAQSAGELEQAVGGTEAVFGAAGRKIDEYAKGAADSVGLSEAAFRNLSTVAGAQLKNLGFDVDDAADKSIQLTEIGADLAATYGGTTAEAVEALGAAFRGEADPAERFGLRLGVNAANAKAVEMGLAESTAAVDDHARAQAILALIMEQSADAQGQFAREGDTLLGQQQRLTAQFEDLKAEIGAGAIPVMKTLADVTGNVVGGLMSANSATGGLLGQVATIATVTSVAAGGLSLVVGQVLKMKDTFVAAKDGIAAFAGDGGLGRLGKTLARGGVLIGGLYLLDQALDQVVASDPRAADVDKLDTMLRRFGRTAQVSGELANVAGDDFGKLKDAFDTLNSSSPSDTLDRTNDRLNSVLSTVTFGAADASTAVEEAQQVFSDFDAALAGIAERDPGMAFDILTAAADASGLSVEQLKAELPEYGGAVDEAKESAAEAGVEVDEFGRALDGSADSTDNAKTALEEYSDKLNALFDPLFGAVSAAHSLRDANQEVADKTAALTEAEAKYGVGSAEATEAALALSDAQTAATEAAADHEGALLTLRGAVDDGTVSVDAAKAKLAEWVEQGVITQASADATARELDGVAWSAGAIPTGKTIAISMTGAAPVIGQLDDIARRVNSLSGGKFRVSVGGGGGLVLHDGGIVPGPRGQEVAAVLQAGEEVLSLDDPRNTSTAGGSTGGGGGGGGAPVINVYATGSILAERDIVRIVREAVDKGALWSRGMRRG